MLHTSKTLRPRFLASLLAILVATASAVPVPPTCDVAIVGAGPGGAYVANRLATATQAQVSAIYSEKHNVVHES